MLFTVWYWTQLIYRMSLRLLRVVPPQCAAELEVEDEAELVVVEPLLQCIRVYQLVHSVDRVQQAVRLSSSQGLFADM